MVNAIDLKSLKGNSHGFESTNGRNHELQAVNQLGYPSLRGPKVCTQDIFSRISTAGTHTEGLEFHHIKIVDAFFSDYFNVQLSSLLVAHYSFKFLSKVL